MRRARWQGCVLTAVAALFACAPEAGGGSSGTSDPGTTNGLEEDTGSSTQPADGGSETQTESEAGTSSGAPATSESSSGSDSGGTVEALCRTARTEGECTALDPRCMWQPVVRVIDVATCELGEPESSCWAKPDGGVAGCFGYWPLACVELEVQPFHRELDGVVQLLDLQGPCTDTPLAPSDEPQWEYCPTDEFEPAPPACYCLCGSR